MERGLAVPKNVTKVEELAMALSGEVVKWRLAEVLVARPRVAELQRG